MSWEPSFLSLSLDYRFTSFFQIQRAIQASVASNSRAINPILSYIAGALFLLILYPFSRFAYESIVEFVMGNNVIISNALLFLTYKYISYAILLCFSFVIAPIGMIILFFYNKHQFKLAQDQAVQATEQNQ